MMMISQQFVAHFGPSHGDVPTVTSFIMSEFSDDLIVGYDRSTAAK